MPALDLDFIRTVLFATAAIALLAGCGSAMSSQPSVVSQSGPRYAARKTTSSCPCVYVANQGQTSASQSVTVYPIGANGNVAPIADISGSKTGVIDPIDVSLDAGGNVYVANIGQSVNVFAAGASGNVPPLRTISGSKTLMAGDPPHGVAVNPVNGDIYVALYDSLIVVFAAGASGNVKPVEKISGKNTQLVGPEELVLDGSGNVLVPNGAAPSVNVYAAGSFGNINPTEFIYGSKTGLIGPLQIALDSTGNIYVANNGAYGVDRGIYVYAAGANGNEAPIRTISGPNTKLGVGPEGIALDAKGNIYVSDNDAILVFAAGAKGDVKPIREISGSKTALSSPFGIAIQ